LSYIIGMTTSPCVLLAPDKFKGTLTAAEVARSLSRGIRTSRPDVDVRVLPVADGGEGSVAAALAAGFRSVAVQTVDASGEPTMATIARADGHAVLELASICGLARSGRVDPEQSTSAGVGVAMKRALDAGCTRLTVGLGGSASTDGGLGLVVALGARLVDGHGDELEPVTSAIPQATRLDLSGLDPRLASARITFAADVDATLLGPNGAARLFAPQKGADAPTVERLEAAMERWANLLDDAWPGVRRDLPRGGAAGGVGFAAQAIGADVVDGAQTFLDLVGADTAMSSVDLVVTGEGRLDEQTLMGKAPAAIAERSRQRGIPCVAVVGSRSDTITDADLAAHGFGATYELVNHSPDVTSSVEASRAALRDAGASLAFEHLPEGNNHQVGQGAVSWR
jgi:glycerate kinase